MAARIDPRRHLYFARTSDRVAAGLIFARSQASVIRALTAKLDQMRKHRAEISFTRLTEIPVEDLVNHMRDPRVGAHMPLLNFEWDEKAAMNFVAAKEECWRRDGLGHWAFLHNGDYAGWGGFQKEGEEWDFGLVLTPAHFGLGGAIIRKSLDFARNDERIPHVTFLLPYSRRHLGALDRLGAIPAGDVEYDGAIFRKFRLETPNP